MEALGEDAASVAGILAHAHHNAVFRGDTPVLLTGQVQPVEVAAGRVEGGVV
jgi:hypothetical protein